MEIRQHKKPTRPHRSKIHFPNGEVWTYKVGIQSVSLNSPDLTKTYIVSVNDVTGDAEAEKKNRIAHQGNIEEIDCSCHGGWKGVLPSQVKAWIDQHLRHV